MIKNTLAVAVEQARHPHAHRTETGEAIPVAGSRPVQTDARPSECWVGNLSGENQAVPLGNLDEARSESWNKRP
ncbi:MAG TPA: hypothetical protein DCS43_06645 [Verrucomicrobia bacterium]|nr:hypothetical protein [Verrucomicrobiota bacterium]